MQFFMVQREDRPSSTWPAGLSTTSDLEVQLQAFRVLVRSVPIRTDSPRPSIGSLHPSESSLPGWLGLALRAIFGVFVRILLFSCKCAARLCYDCAFRWAAF